MVTQIIIIILATMFNTSKSSFISSISYLGNYQSIWVNWRKNIKSCCKRSLWSSWTICTGFNSKVLRRRSRTKCRIYIPTCSDLFSRSWSSNLSVSTQISWIMSQTMLISRISFLRAWDSNTLTKSVYKFAK